MKSRITGHRLWNIKLFFFYFDVIMTIFNWFHFLVLYYVPPVTCKCCELRDKMSILLRSRYLFSGGLSRVSATFAFWDWGWNCTEDMDVCIL